MRENIQYHNSVTFNTVLHQNISGRCARGNLVAEVACLEIQVYKSFAYLARIKKVAMSVSCIHETVLGLFFTVNTITEQQQQP